MKDLSSDSSTRADRVTAWFSRIRGYNIIVIAAALLLGVLFSFTGIAENMEHLAVSGHILASARPYEQDQRVVVVMCTDSTIDNLEPGTGWPIPRSYYTELLQGALAPADTVVFDILFADTTDEQADQAFADAVARHGRVILARSQTTLPIDALFYSGARIGYAIEFNEKGSDAVSRSYKLYVNSDLRSGPTLICSALLSQGYDIKYDGRNSYIVTSPNGEVFKLRVDSEGYFYRIPTQHGLDTTVIDLYDVYSGNYEPGLFDNAVVFIGGTVAGYEDVVYAPDFEVGENYSGGSAAMRVVGTKYLADSYCTVLRGFSPVDAGAIAEVIACAVMFLLTALLAIRLPLKYNWLVPICAGLGWFGLSRMLFVSGLCCLSTASPIICCALAYLTASVIRLVRTSRERTISSLPIETLYHIAYELDYADPDADFDQYMRHFGEDVFKQLEVTIIHTHAPRSLLPAEVVDDISRRGASTIRSREIYAQFGVRSIIVIPLPVFDDEEEIYTVLGTDRHTTAHWVQSVTALVLAMYVYYEAQHQSSERHQMAMSMIEMVIQLIDAKDPVTAGHSRRVSEYARKIAQWLGYDRRRVDDVEFAALLHDIGKIGVADSVLNKPGLFTDDDFTQMRSHPSLGADIVRTIGLSEDIVDGVLHHHERLDGRGYPDGTPGGEYARIIKVADVYDALTSQRQYKSAWTPLKALDVINSGIGTEFDERIARTFIENTAPEYYDAGQSSESRQVVGNPVLKLTEFSQRFRQLIDIPTDQAYSVMSRMEHRFDFDCARRFSGLEWGERFGSACVLRELPSILHYDEESGTVISALAGQDGDTVHCSFFYFYKGCLSAGLASVLGEKVSKAEASLTRLHGKPTSENGCLLWKARSHTVIKVHGDGLSAFVFITNYLSNEI